MAFQKFEKEMIFFFLKRIENTPTVRPIRHGKLRSNGRKWNIIYSFSFRDEQFRSTEFGWCTWTTMNSMFLSYSYFFSTSLRRIKMSAKLGWLSLLACYFLLFSGAAWGLFAQVICGSMIWGYSRVAFQMMICLEKWLMIWNETVFHVFAEDRTLSSVDELCIRVFFCCCWCCCIRFITGELINIFVIFVCVLFLWKSMQAKLQIMEKKKCMPEDNDAAFVYFVGGGWALRA